MVTEHPVCVFVQQQGSHTSSSVLQPATTSEWIYPPGNQSPPVLNLPSQSSQFQRRLHWCRVAERRNNPGAQGSGTPLILDMSGAGERAGWPTAARWGWGWWSTMFAWGGRERWSGILLEFSNNNLKWIRDIQALIFKSVKKYFIDPKGKLLCRNSSNVPSNEQQRMVHY